MKHLSIGYHTRLDGQNTTKISGGSFGGTIDQQTVERLVNAHFEVTIKPSGRAVFVDRNGREVSLYLSVNPDCTEKGKAAIQAHQKTEEARNIAAQAKSDEEEEELQDALANLTHAEAIRLLKGR